MPLRDHFHPPADVVDWASVHSSWAAAILRRLNRQLLPARYRASVQAHLGVSVEPDVTTFDTGGPAAPAIDSGNGGVAVATAVWAPPQATASVEVEFAAPDVFEVRVQDDRRGRLVAAVELVSPRNKDRPESRRAFAAKWASYLQAQVSVVVADVVTERQQSLYAELLDLLGLTGRLPGGDADLYAVASRTTKPGGAWRMEVWPHELGLGRPLPTLPLWLADNLAVPLDLESGYEEACLDNRLR
jgi:hypothetical protein